ncbi:hypothetical protein [Chloroflexus aurantiacus]
MHRLLIGLLCLLVISGCANTTVSEPSPTAAVPYPVYPVEPVPTNPAVSYPGPDTSGQSQANLFFYIAEPVRVSDGQIRGGGPPQAPIRVINLSRNNAVIADTVVGADGQFVAPLRDVAAGDSVAIIFNEQGGSTFTREQLQPFSVQVLPSGELVMSSVVIAP